MRRLLPALLCGLLWATSTRAQGLLIPTATDVPPLAMHSHEVKVIIEDQVAVTNVVQTFRNHTDRPLEATYVFPVPKGASVKKFTMWVEGKEVPGELVEADKARTIYTDIVRRTQDPGLLEYLGNNLLRVRVFPVPARGDQKLAVSYTSIAGNDAGLIEYVYPLRADAKGSGRALEKFSLEATLKAQQPITTVYSPTHAVTISRPSDRQVIVRFEKQQAALDKDFQLYYAAGAGDVGLTALTHRPRRDANGHFLLLISPRAELSKRQQVPRDLVFVLDTSGSMAGARIRQARNALNYCLRNLDAGDRFGLIHFATTVNPYNTRLLPATRDQLDRARQWVDNLEATGSTNIDEALAAALAMRADETGRSFTVVFFTDGQPTIGETDPAQIVKNVAAKNTANTRIFTFGVGDDVNAVLLDQLADKTRSVATYVRESEDIEAKVSGLYAKISRPVLTDLKLSVGPNVTLTEVYPPHLPDLFHGSQLVVLGRYHGKGAAAVTLTGTVGKQHRGVCRLRGQVPRPYGQRPGVRGGSVGAAQGRLPARPDSHQRREEGSGGRGGGAGEALRHHDALYQLPRRAGRPDAGGWRTPGMATIYEPLDRNGRAGEGYELAARLWSSSTGNPAQRRSCQWLDRIPAASQRHHGHRFEQPKCVFTNFHVFEHVLGTRSVRRRRRRGRRGRVKLRDGQQAPLQVPAHPVRQARRGPVPATERSAQPDAARQVVAPPGCWPDLCPRPRRLDRPGL